MAAVGGKDQKTCKQAIKEWQDQNKVPAAEAKVVKLIGCVPPIKKMDNKLNDLVACEQLSLSTNAIDKIGMLAGLKNLRILSLARNNISKIQKLDDVAGTLEELWISYNLVDKLDGLKNLKKLKKLYIGNNKIRRFDELVALKDLPVLEDLLLVGNPIYDECKDPVQRRLEVIARLPKLQKLDGVAVVAAEREAALKRQADEKEPPK